MILEMILLSQLATKPNAAITQPLEVPPQAQEIFPRADYTGKSTVDVPVKDAKTLQVYVDRSQFGDKSKQIFLRIESEDAQTACYSTISAAEQSKDRQAFQQCNFPTANQKFTVSIDARTDTGKTTNGYRDPAKESPATVNTMVQVYAK